MTLDHHLQRHARDNGDRPAIFSPSGRLTYAELDQLVGRAARGLRRIGVPLGGRVGLLLRKTPEAIVSYFAANRAGCAAAPLNYRLEPPQLERILRILELDALIAHDTFVPLVSRLAPGLPGGERIFLVSAASGGLPATGFGSWDTLLKEAPGSTSLPEADPEETAYIDFTSGSTGMPKGALTAHRAIAWNTRSVVESLGIGPDDVHLPLFAVYSHPHEMFARSVTLGGATVLLDAIQPKAIAASIDRWGVSCVMGLPPIYEVLLPALRARRPAGTLRLLESGGMVTPWDLIDRFHRHTGKEIVPVWGCTETAGVSIFNKRALKGRDESMGVPCQGVEARAIDSRGAPVGGGEVGELAIRSGSVFRRYLVEEGADVYLPEHGEHRTGDLVRLDPAGRFHFVSRKDEMMKVAGLKVYPAEVERVLRGHPSVSQVVVAAARGRARGVFPKAFVVAGEPVSATELRRYCRLHLAPYKVPRIVEFLDSLPTTGSGKPDRKSLSEA